MKNPTKTTTIIIALISLLIISGIYIGVTTYNEMMLRKEYEFFQQGATSAIVQIIEVAIRCEQVPLIFGNQTVNLIAVDCLQGQGG